MKTTEWTITLEGQGGELDRRGVSIPDGTPDEKEEAAVREAVLDLVAASTLADGDVIRISRVFA